MLHFHDMAKGKQRTILALDPGTSNMGISVVQTNGSKVKVLANGVMKAPLKSVKSGVRDAINTFLSELDSWVNEFSPNALIAERFMARGTSRQTTGEMISMMLGAIVVHYPDMPIKFVPAVTWKGPWQKRHGLDLEHVYKVCKTTPHQLDATLIGVYGIEKGTGIEVTSTPKEIVLMAEASSRERLVNRKLRNSK